MIAGVLADEIINELAKQIAYRVWYVVSLFTTMKLSDIPSSLALLLLLLCSCSAFFAPTSIGGSKTTTQLLSTIEKDTVTTETNNAALLKRDRYIATNRKLILCF